MAQKIIPQQQSSYGYPQGSQSVFPSPIKATRNPTTNDLGYPIGQLWINTVSSTIFGMTGSAGGSATWSLCSPGASDVDTINSLSPVAGNIVIAGGTNLTDVNLGNTITLNLDAAITLATSVTSPLYTSGAGADVQVTAPAGQNIVLQMGDAAGANKVSFTDSTATEVFAIDSNGSFVLAGVTVNGVFTQTAGVVNIGQDNAANAINIGGGTTARAIGIGNSAAPHTLTLGSTNTTAATVLQAGTGKFTMTGTVRELTGDYVTRTGDSITFYSNPTCSTVLNTGGAPTGATGDVNIVHCREGVIMEEFVIGAGQTIIAPRMDASGLLVSGDLTVGEGWEYNFGAARTNSRHAFTIGTSAAFMFQLRFRINDMDGAAPYIFGFRKSEANNATFANYTDYAAIGMNAGTSATQIVIYDELNSGGQTITNTTDLWGGDGTTNTLTVLVSAAGVVTYLINGLAPTATHAFTFDNADVVVPFIRIEHSASPTQVELVSMKIGYQV